MRVPVSVSTVPLKTSWLWAIVLILLVIASMGTVGGGALVRLQEDEDTYESESMIDRRVRAAFGTLPMYFIENGGQVDPRVALYAHGHGATVYFTTDGLTLALTRPLVPATADAGRPWTSARSVGIGTGRDPPELTQRWAVKLDFVGANPAARPEGIDPTPAIISYFKGPAEEWRTGLRTYASLVYSDLWPGIDLVYTTTAGRLKYTFVIDPGADPERIRLAYRGAMSVALTAGGEIDVSTPMGGFRDDKPYAYQDVTGRRVEVAATYSLGQEFPVGTHGYGFRLGPYDRSSPLVLDPAIVVYAGFIGGDSSDAALGIAVDGAGNAYVAGSTNSMAPTFPVTVGPDLTYNGDGDAFVAKVNPAGTALIYVGYIGGTDIEVAGGIAVDGAGNAYVAGVTRSTESTFPVTVGPDLTHNGGSDAFVAKVNAAGTGLVYAGYIGGSGDESASGDAFPSAIAVDNAGNLYITGLTSSTEATFPVTVGPDLTYNGDYADVFVAKVNAAGTGLVYAGYIGGSGGEVLSAIAVDGAGNAYVTGLTFSTEATFPVTVGPDLTYNGGDDVFVAKVNAAGTGLVYAGYIGGTGIEWPTGVAVDDAGNAYVSGFTRSTEATFPVTVGPDLTHNGNDDAFVAKVNAAGTGLVYAGYIGGDSLDAALGIAVDNAGIAYVVGWTNSTESTFPVTAGPDLSYNGNGDAFIAKVNAAGTALVYAGYIGGGSTELADGIAIDGAGNAYVAGSTNSTEATFPVTAGPDLTHNGNDDAFVAKIQVVVSVECPRSHGYWKNHPGAWPAFSLTLGDETYDSAELHALLRMPSRGDASVILSRQLIAAKLNIANGSDPGPVQQTIQDADAVLAPFAGGLPYSVRASSPTGRAMTALAEVLDDYNNGDLTPSCGACDDDDEEGDHDGEHEHEDDECEEDDDEDDADDHDDDSDDTITFVSDTTWEVFDSAGVRLGPAQNVCLNPLAPSNCPAGATSYGFAGNGWAADLGAIPGATWIWAPGIDGGTDPAYPAEFLFSRVFNLPEGLTAGTLSVAADDFVEVRVNGILVGTSGSRTDHALATTAQSFLVTFDIAPFLRPGANVIVIHAANGVFGCGAGPYQCNPAGVVFGGSLTLADCDDDSDDGDDDERG